MDNSETREYVKVGSFKPADEMNEKGAVIELSLIHISEPTRRS